MTGRVTVSGGAISAELAGLDAYAGLLDQAAATVATVLALVARTAADPMLAASSALDPTGAATMAARLSATVVLAVATEATCRGVSASLRAAVIAYRAADNLGATASTLEQLPEALRLLAEHPGSGGPQSALLADPGLVDVAVQSLAGPIGPKLVSRLLARTYPDGPAVVTRRPDWPVDDGLGPPRSLTDLERGLAVRESADDGGGAVDVRFLQRAGSSERRVVLDITGTTLWNRDPWRRSPQATDLGTNFRAMANQPSVMSRGVIAALTAAGVRPDEEILLVGHSQGGMVGAEVATELVRHSRFRVAGLITAGSPIALASIPASVPVLSLENARDPVPHLDGAPNPAGARWLTVHGDEGARTVLDQHSMRSYEAIAADADASSNPALVEWRHEQNRFFDADSVRTEVFQIRRGP